MESKCRELDGETVRVKDEMMTSRNTEEETQIYKTTCELHSEVSGSVLTSLSSWISTVILLNSRDLTAPITDES